ncbi:MAG: hypothetical protein NZ922_05560 [Candidatus Methanomethyliaceae archaeon]|nr:hypothetical protein [Candidatus Methanomethyliaceae archaeon]MDW7971233.1 hypothetical protein [Nitrososphaerota archaeon]
MCFDNFLLIGSLFYKGDRKVKDHKRGIVDTKALLREIRKVKRLKERTGISHAVDIIAETPDAMENYLDIISEITEDFIFIGGLNEETRIAGYRKAKELGINQRCGVNSISPFTTDNELEAIKENGIKYAIAQTLDPNAIYPDEKLCLLRNTILEKCKNLKIAVDVGVIDFTSIWLAMEAIKLIKKELAIPAGCAPSNAAYQPLINKKVSKMTARAINVALTSILQIINADFIIYGPLKAAEYIFEAAAVVEGIKGYGEKLQGKALDKNHPLYKYLMNLT